MKSHIICMLQLVSFTCLCLCCLYYLSLPTLTLSIDIIVIQKFTQSVKALDLFVNIYFLFFLSMLTEVDIACT